MKDKAAAAPFVRQPGSGETVNVLGVTHVYKATARETAGAFSLWEALVPPGHGAPAHTHQHEDESFYVLSGEILVQCEGEPAPHRVTAGAFFFGARGRQHSFFNAAEEPARVLFFSTPSTGLDGMFAALQDATAKGISDGAAIGAIVEKFGVTLAPPA